MDGEVGGGGGWRRGAWRCKDGRDWDGDWNGGGEVGVRKGRRARRWIGKGDGDGVGGGGGGGGGEK